MSVLVSPSNVIRLDGNVSNSTVNFADVTGLAFTAVANADYLVEVFALYVTAATTTGLNLAINGPAAAVGVGGEWQAYSSDTTVLSRQFRAFDANAGATTGVTAASPSVNWAQLTTLLRTGANGGAVTIRFASEVAASQVTIVAGSILRYQQTAPVSLVNTMERFSAVSQVVNNAAQMSNNMRANTVGIQTSKNNGTIPTFAAAQQAFRDLGTAFKQRLDKAAAIVTPNLVAIQDGSAAVGIQFSDLQARNTLLNTWADNLRTAVVTNQSQMDTLVSSLLAAVPATILPFS